jgi:rhodanese-related sulfurtransferase
VSAANTLPLEIAPAEVKRRLDAGETLKLIDVREPKEFQISRIEGADLIPMGSVPARLNALEAQADDSTLIVFCHHGMRSLSVVNWLRQQGVAACQSMAGGIDRWSRQVDPSVPLY